MKIRSVLLSLTFLSSSALAASSAKIDKEFIKIGYLKQASGQAIIPFLPWDILTLISTNIFDRTYNTPDGVLITNGTDKRWVYLEELASHDEKTGQYASWSFADPVSAIARFHDRKDVSDASTKAIVKRRKQINVALLQKLSVQWKESLETIVSKQQRMSNKPWSCDKAYAAALIAYHFVKHAAPYLAALTAAKAVILKAALNADPASANGSEDTRTDWEWDAFALARTAQNSALNSAKIRFYAIVGSSLSRTAFDVAEKAALGDTLYAAGNAAEGATRTKLEVLGPTLALKRGPLSYKLAELFTLLWLTENGSSYLEKAFDAAYKELSEAGIVEAKAQIEEAISRLDLAKNPFLEALQRDLEPLAGFCYGEYGLIDCRPSCLKPAI